MMENVLMIESGFTTQLKTRIEDTIEGHPLWGTQCLLTNPHAVVDTHRDFIRSGVDVLVTNTYQASIEGFKKYLNLSESQSYDLIRSSVDNCREAIAAERAENEIYRNKRFLIAGSVGSFGAFLADGSEYRGDYVGEYDIDFIKEWHRPRIRALVEAGVDLLAFETMPAQEEAEMLVQLLKEFPGVKAWLSFSAKDDLHISHGEVFKDAATKCWGLNPEQIVAIGVNCTETKISTELMVGLMNKGIPMIVYPNAGQIWDGERKVWMNNEKAESLTKFVETWCRMGIKYVGGCCGTSMMMRRHMRKVIDEFNSEKKTLNIE